MSRVRQMPALGPGYWANRLHDWQIRGGRALCILGNRDRRTVHRTGTSIRGNGGDFTLAITTGRANGNLNATQSPNTAERQRGVLLLSDGLQNRPASTFVPSDTGYNSCNGAAFANCADSNVEVNTVAFGTGGSVDEALLT